MTRWTVAKGDGCRNRRSGGPPARPSGGAPCGTGRRRRSPRCSAGGTSSRCFRRGRASRRSTRWPGRCCRASRWSSRRSSPCRPTSSRGSTSCRTHPRRSRSIRHWASGRSKQHGTPSHRAGLATCSSRPSSWPRTTSGGAWAPSTSRSSPSTRRTAWPAGDMTSAPTICGSTRCAASWALRRPSRSRRPAPTRCVARSPSAWRSATRWWWCATSTAPTSPSTSCARPRRTASEARCSRSSATSPGRDCCTRPRAVRRRSTPPHSARRDDVPMPITRACPRAIAPACMSASSTMSSTWSSRRTPSAWESTSRMCGSSRTPPCPSRSTPTTRRSAAPAATERLPARRSSTVPRTWDCAGTSSPAVRTRSAWRRRSPRSRHPIRPSPRVRSPAPSGSRPVPRPASSTCWSKAAPSVSRGVALSPAAGSARARRPQPQWRRRSGAPGSRPLGSTSCDATQRPANASGACCSATSATTFRNRAGTATRAVPVPPRIVRPITRRYAAGETVDHAEWGRGSVVDVQDDRMTVFFEEQG